MASPPISGMTDAAWRKAVAEAIALSKSLEGRPKGRVDVRGPLGTIILALVNIGDVRLQRGSEKDSIWS